MHVRTTRLRMFHKMSLEAINTNKKIFLNHVLMVRTQCCDVANETVSAKSMSTVRQRLLTVM